jgi:hypothetical protein
MYKGTIMPDGGGIFNVVGEVSLLFFSWSVGRDSISGPFYRNERLEHLHLHPAPISSQDEDYSVVLTVVTVALSHEFPIRRGSLFTKWHLKLAPASSAVTPADFRAALAHGFII